MGGAFCGTAPNGIPSEPRGREVVRYILNTHNVVTYAVTPPGGNPLPAFRPEAMRGHDYLSAVPEDQRDAIGQAIARVRRTRCPVALDAIHPRPPYPPRLLWITPGRRPADVMIAVYDPTGQPQRRMTDRQTDRARGVPRK